MAALPPAVDAAAPLLDLALRPPNVGAAGKPRVLTLADGDCGYAAALAKARPDLEVHATTYDVRSRVPEEHAAAVAQLRCEIDGTDPLPGECWDRIVCNFPAPIGRQHVTCGRQLVRRLLARSAAALSAEGGQVWLTLEANVSAKRPCPAEDDLGMGQLTVGGSSSSKAKASKNASGHPDWDVTDAAAEADLVLVKLLNSQAKSVYKPQGVKSDGVTHVFEPAASKPQAMLPTVFVRDVNVPASKSLEELRETIAHRCAPVEAQVELLNSFTRDGHESWTIRVRFSAASCALSRRKVHLLCEAIETGGWPRKLEPELPPPAPRRKGWTVWCHKVEPSVEDFLSLVARPVARGEDARLVWANAAWKHPSGAFTNHFEDAVLDKRDAAAVAENLPAAGRGRRLGAGIGVILDSEAFTLGPRHLRHCIPERCTANRPTRRRERVCGAAPAR
eukprot:TRINITY_DN57700_c0_g1_i2.p1 TRINITY_DN57700_c0_g1~~TRINITY_DN57700_c0_g1_i2.p1  ORF type:complete len:448 (-),score=83.16 TRINITY_DN57700_c0_g1_i2:570-1913(-)